MCLFGAEELLDTVAMPKKFESGVLTPTTRQMFSVHSTNERNLKKQQSPALEKLECTL